MALVVASNSRSVQREAWLNLPADCPVCLDRVQNRDMCIADGFAMCFDCAEGGPESEGELVGLHTSGTAPPPTEPAPLAVSAHQPPKQSVAKKPASTTAKKSTTVQKSKQTKAKRVERVVTKKPSQDTKEKKSTTAAKSKAQKAKLVSKVVAKKPAKITTAAKKNTVAKGKVMRKAMVVGSPRPPLRSSGARFS